MKLPDVVFWLLILAWILLFFLALSKNLTLFEDGSFGVGEFPYMLKGCLPWAICNR